MIKRLILALVSVVLAGGAFAQDDDDGILLVPFTDNNSGIAGVVPSSWQQFSPGLWLRAEPPQTLIAQQGVVGDMAEIVPALLQQFGLPALPEPVETLTANGLDWALYESDGPAGSNIVLDFALSTQGASVYLVILQASADERAALREAVFLPAVEALTPVDPPPAAPEDGAYRAENVAFNSGAIVLAGTLTLPLGDGPHPAVVLISGSGPQDRDETLPGIRLAPFAVIADHLTRAGIAVLRYDDRGYARSGGDHDAATSADFAADARAAVDYLQTRPEIDAAQIGVLGHSEGGLIAAHLAESDAPVAFYVLMAGVTVTGEALLIEQNQRIYDAEGLSQEEKDSQLAFVTQMFPLVKAGDVAGLTALLEQRVIEQVEALPADVLAQIPDLDAFIGQNISAQLTDLTRPWWPYFLAYDPAGAWQATSAPVLGVFGTLDVQVDAEQNAAALQAALEAGGSEDFEIVTLPEANHLFQQAISGAVSEYPLLEPVFVDTFLPTITDWILEHVTLPEP